MADQQTPYDPVTNFEVLRHLKENMLGTHGLGTETPQGGGIQLPQPKPQVITHSLSGIKHTHKGL